jgi:two-component system copper resistance phosphate regulon response regulator CusR
MRVLIVDDERKVAEMVAKGLRAEHLSADIAESGEEAWRMARASEFNVMVLDLGLPGMGGSDLLKALRREQVNMPVLILSARDSTASKIENLEAGADDYLTKPFALAELVVRVKALLRRGPASLVQTQWIADLEIDKLHQEVKRAGRRIELTPKEYSLLEYLVANTDRVVSRTMIMEHVWDQSFEGLTNIVDVYVRHLRAKIDDPFPEKLIRTVRGVGYRLAEGEAA